MVPGDNTGGGDMDAEEGGCEMGTGREEGAELAGSDGSKDWVGEDAGSECWACWALRLD